METILRFVLVFFLLIANSWAGDSLSPWYTQDDNKRVTLNVELFLSSTCPHCHNADAFFNNIDKTTHYLHIQRNIINEDKNALLRFNQLLSEQHMDDFAVPSIYFCNSRWVGFATVETTGKDLLHALNYCKQQIEKDGALTPATVDTLRHWANANKFDSGMVEHPSSLSYIATIAITDAFAPCAFFCFAGFLAFLFLGDSRNKQIKAGFLFIFSVAIAHYFQQVNTSAFYELLPWLRIPAILSGMLALYFVRQYYKKQRSDSLFFLLAFFLGFMTTVYQQTCVMNWSFIFEQWLNNQHITHFQAALYQLLYQILYVLPLIFILIFHRALLRLKRIAALQPRLVRIGLLFVLAIALCLIVYPMLLSYLAISVLILVLLAVCGCFLNLT